MYQSENLNKNGFFKKKCSIYEHILSSFLLLFYLYISLQQG